MAKQTPCHLLVNFSKGCLYCNMNLNKNDAFSWTIMIACCCLASIDRQTMCMRFGVKIGIVRICDLSVFSPVSNLSALFSAIFFIKNFKNLSSSFFHCPFHFFLKYLWTSLVLPSPFHHRKKTTCSNFRKAATFKPLSFNGKVSNSITFTYMLRD